MSVEGRADRGLANRLPLRGLANRLPLRPARHSATSAAPASAAPEAPTCTCSTASATSGRFAATSESRRCSSAVPAPMPRYGASTPSVRMYSLGPCGTIRARGWRVSASERAGRVEPLAPAAAAAKPASGQLAPVASFPSDTRWPPPARRCGTPAVVKSGEWALGWAHARGSRQQAAAAAAEASSSTTPHQSDHRTSPPA